MATFLDAVGKRVAVAYIGLGLVGLWLSQMILHAWQLLEGYHLDRPLSPLKDLTLFMQWSSVGSLALVVLYLLQIPKLAFHFRRLVAMLCALWILQGLVFLPDSPVSIRTFIVRWKSGDELDRMDPSLVFSLQDKQSSTEGDDSSSPLGGSVTLKILPQSSAQWLPPSNPQKLCLARQIYRPSLSGRPASSVQTQSIELSVLLMGVPPWTLDYALVSSSKEETKHSVHIKPPHSAASDPLANEEALATGEDGVVEGQRYVFSLTVTSAGVYFLRSLTDSKGAGVVSPDPMTIQLCPEALWNVTELKLQHKMTLCRKESKRLLATLYGQPPLSLTYIIRDRSRKDRSSRVHESEQTLTTTFSQPEVASFKKQVNDAHTIELSVGPFDQVTELDYFITKVVDNFGLVTEYTETEDADQVFIQVVDRPFARLGCANQDPIAVMVDETDPLLARTPPTVPIFFERSEGPWILEYIFRAPDGVEQKRTININHQSPYMLKLEHIGSYYLQKLRDPMCTGEVDPGVCQVIQLFPPTIDIKAAFIETPCFGEIGMSFDLHLTGIAPWIVRYELSYEGKHPELKTAQLTRSSDRIEIKPPNPGVYTVRFLDVKDSSYPETIAIQSDTFTKQFHPPSSASLSNDYRNQICIGESTSLKLSLSGTGPWILQYAILGPGLKSKQVLNATSNQYQVVTPEFQAAGKYSIEFRSIQDANGCKSELNIPPAQIEVVEQRPTVAFSGSHDHGSVSYRLASGSILDAPLVLDGLEPFNVELQFSENEDSQIWEQMAPITVNRRNNAIRLTKPGRYRLLSVKDRVCAGSAVEPKLATVKIIPKPTALIDGIRKISTAKEHPTFLKEVRVCPGEKAILSCHATGQGPFRLIYRVEYDPCPDSGFLKGTNCQKKHEDFNLNMAQQEAIIELQTPSPGLYTYSLISISDLHYQDVSLVTSQETNISATIRVHPLPGIKLKPQRRNVCVRSGLNPSLGLSMDVEGASPWILSYTVVCDRLGSVPAVAVGHQTEQKDVTIRQSPFLFVPEVNFTEVGVYRFYLHSIQDANGCKRSLSEAGDTESSLEVAVASEPSLSFEYSHSDYACVGEVINVKLQGVPPFTLDYSYEVKGVVLAKTVTVNDDEKGFFGGSWFGSSRDDGTSLQASQSITKKIGLKFAEEGRLRLHKLCHGTQDAGSDGRWCCKEYDGLEQNVYGLPSAKINEGHHAMELIREGNEIRSRIDLHGHAPFSFSYVRTTDHGVELESHTITDVRSNQYELTLAQAGTFRITSVSDRYCQYPRRKRQK